MPIQSRRFDHHWKALGALYRLVVVSMPNIDPLSINSTKSTPTIPTHTTPNPPNSPFPSYLSLQLLYEGDWTTIRIVSLRSFEWYYKQGHISTPLLIDSTKSTPRIPMSSPKSTFQIRIFIKINNKTTIRIVILNVVD